MTDPIQIDAHAFPLVVATFPEVLTVKAVDLYSEEMAAVAARGRFALVADISGMSMRDLDPNVRKYFFDAASRWEAGPGHRSRISEAIVLKGWLARTVVAAYLWQVQPSGFDLRIMASMDEARAWSLAKIARKPVRETG